MCPECKGKGEIQLLTSVVPCKCQLGEVPSHVLDAMRYNVSGTVTGRMRCSDLVDMSPELVASSTIKQLDHQRDLYEVTLMGTYGRSRKINTSGPFLKKYQDEEASSSGVYFDKALELLSDYYADRMVETGWTRKQCKTEGFMTAYGSGPPRHFNSRCGEIRSDRQRMSTIVQRPREATLTVELMCTGKGAILGEEFNQELGALLKKHGFGATMLNVEYTR